MLQLFAKMNNYFIVLWVRELVLFQEGAIQESGVIYLA